MAKVAQYPNNVRMDQNYRANILVMCNVWNEPIILCKFVPE